MTAKQTTEAAIAEIKERRAKSKLDLGNILLWPTGAEIDTLLVALEERERVISYLESLDGDGNCRFCGQLRSPPQGHNQRCYCIQLARARAENDELFRQIQYLRGNQVAESPQEGAKADDVKVGASEAALTFIQNNNVRIEIDSKAFRSLVRTIIYAYRAGEFSERDRSNSHAGQARNDVLGEAIAKVAQVRLRLWRQYTDNQTVLLNMVCNEILPELESLKRV